MAVDETEFSEFFASQYGRLCWLALLLTGSRAQAEELAQEALARTWRRWKLVRRLDDPGSYARRVLVNRHRSLLRRGGGGGAVAGALGPAEEVAPPAADERAMVLWQAVLVARGRPKDRGPSRRPLRSAGPRRGVPAHRPPAAGGSRSS